MAQEIKIKTNRCPDSIISIRCHSKCLCPIASRPKECVQSINSRLLVPAPPSLPASLPLTLGIDALKVQCNLSCLDASIGTLGFQSDNNSIMRI